MVDLIELSQRVNAYLSDNPTNPAIDTLVRDLWRALQEANHLRPPADWAERTRTKFPTFMDTPPTLPKPEWVPAEQQLLRAMAEIMYIQHIKGTVSDEMWQNLHELRRTVRAVR
jgi:hypothetical protein